MLAEANQDCEETITADEIAMFCKDRGIALVGCIPYDTTVTEAMVSGLPVTAYTGAPVAQALKEIWQQIRFVLLAKDTGSSPQEPSLRLM